jgi:hypothetical protein
MKHHDPITGEELRRIPRGEDYAGYLCNTKGDRYYLPKNWRDLPEDQMLKKVDRIMPPDERARRTIKPKAGTSRAAARVRILGKYQKKSVQLLAAMTRELSKLG